MTQLNKMLTMPYGSRLYGTFDENSDYDWKTVILPDPVPILMGHQIKNQFFSTAHQNVKNTSEDTDTELVPIQVFCKDFFAGQTYALEIAFATLNLDEITGSELHNPVFRTIVEELVNGFLTSNINAMVGYAYNQAQLYSAKGDRLDKLHQVQEFIIDAVNANPYLGLLEGRFGVLFPAIKDCNLIDKLVYFKNTPNPGGADQVNLAILEKLYPENITVREALDRLSVAINRYGKRANKAMENEGKDWKAISHAVRITYEALEVLNNRCIKIPFDQPLIDHLRDIKYGRLDWDDVEKELLDNIASIKDAQVTTKLPVSNQKLQADFNDWYYFTITKLYRGKL